jgi:hypothetical protein
MFHMNLEKQQCGSHRGGLVPGGALIILGLGFLLHHLGLLPGGLASPWHVWPSILIWAGLVHLIGQRRRGERVWGLVLLAVGAAIQAHYLHFLALNWGLVVPGILILVGLIVVLSSFGKRGCRQGEQSESSYLDGAIHTVIKFGAKAERFDGRAFKGGDVDCVCAGYELNLLGAEMIGDEAVLNIHVVMGGIELTVPRSWRVEVEASPVMGGFDDKTGRAYEPVTKRLIIRGKVVLGGVEIKN